MIRLKKQHFVLVGLVVFWLLAGGTVGQAAQCCYITIVRFGPLDNVKVKK